MLVAVVVTAHAEQCCARAEQLAAENLSLRAEVRGLRADKRGLLAKVADLEGLVSTLGQTVATYAKMLFGTSSEKQPPAKAEEPPRGPNAGASTGRDASGEGAKRRRGKQPGTAGHGRRDYEELDVEEQVHNVPEGERACPCCGAPYEPFGEETSTQVDWKVRLIRVLHRRRTYRRTCRCASRAIVAAPVVPKPIAKGLFTEAFLARLLTEKFVLGRPLHRIAAALAHDGLRVSEGTLTGVLRQLSSLLGPLDAQITARGSASGHLHIDETSWKVFEAVEDKENFRWWLWAFLGPDTSVFKIAPTRSTQVLAEHLGIDLSADELEAGRHLVVSSDFYGAYQSIAKIDGVEPLWCWAHIRRYFIRAADAHGSLRDWSKAWLERIAALYAAHRRFGDAEPGSAAAASATTQLAVALEVIDRSRKAESDGGLHWAAQEVLATLDHEWEGLARHLEYPHLPLDNNRAERALRGPVVGRKNFYGSGTTWSAELAGRVWTVTATASQRGLNPLVYLTSYLEACARSGSRPPEGEALERFLVWQAAEVDLEAWRYRGPGP
ncbi:MAG: IS66 family transposase [Acidimicrobiales bacterium]